jgi:hypothetical protein
MSLDLAKHDIRSHFDEVALRDEASLMAIFTAFGWIDAAIVAKNHESPGLLQTPLLVAAALHFRLPILYPALRKWLHA